MILAIESSCDESAVCIMHQGKVLSHQLYSQIEHAKYNGVVPQIAAKLHMMHLPELIKGALEEAGIALQDIECFAATAGPGLINSVMIGMIYAKTFSGMLKKPFIAVNHLEAHALSAMIEDAQLKTPYIMLLISGGHSQFLAVEGLGKYKLLGGTLDDSAGECFDKVARMIGLSYPGGPQIEAAAVYGDENTYPFPIAMHSKEYGCKMSFSGIKTFALNLTKSLNLAEMKNQDPTLHKKTMQNIAASFQKCIADNLCYKTEQAIAMYRKLYNTEAGNTLVAAGGVAANKYIMAKLKLTANTHNMQISSPPIELCTDNAIMVAYAAQLYHQQGIYHPLDFTPKSRWPLSSL